MWKSDWEETKGRLTRWWDRKGLVIGRYGALDAGRCVHAQVPPPERPATLEAFYCDPGFRAAQAEHQLSRSAFPLDMLPIATTNTGPGSLALMLGATPGFAEDTVWYHPCWENEEEPGRLPALRFDPDNRWWRVTEAMMVACAERARGKYIVGCPDLIENLDVLASLRGAETLLIDMLERPEWVAEKVREINQAWHEAHERIYRIIRMEDGSSAFGPFRIWGPGRVAKIQCDASAQFSPGMFRRFALPSLAEQCAWLDHSLYHLDGTQAMAHLDALLEIGDLDAVEWTPQAGIETGGSPRWHGMYRRIREAGKSVQVLDVRPEEVVPLLDAIGTEGVYLFVTFADERGADAVRQAVDSRFPGAY
jgi:hypothetical protein